MDGFATFGECLVLELGQFFIVVMQNGDVLDIGIDPYE